MLLVKEINSEVSSFQVHNDTKFVFQIGCANVTYNEYDNAYYLGSEKNPYMILIKAKSQDITSCLIHPDTKIVCGVGFSNCTNLTNLTLPNGITSIISGFSYCGNLILTIPKSLKFIGRRAFYNNYAERKIVYEGASVEWENIFKEYTWNWYAIIKITYMNK